MSRTRINPETGVIEEQHSWIDKQFDVWTPTRDENDQITRVNPETGEVESPGNRINEFLDLWFPKD